MLAPIVLFIYKRLDTLKRTIDALKSDIEANNSELFVFSDAPKLEKDIEKVSQIREYIKTVTGFKKITIIERRQNYGLAKSVITGVTEIVNQYEKVIVLEDDLIVMPNFLSFMNQALDYYANNEKIFSISGFHYNFMTPAGFQYDTYIVNRGCSWGWATWKNRWNMTDWDIEHYKNINSIKFKRSFSQLGSDLPLMLWKQKNGYTDSWLIRWLYNQYIVNKLTVYPILSLVNNNGFDGDATHTTGFNRYKTTFMPKTKISFEFNPNNCVDVYYQKQIQRKFSLFSRVVYGKFFSLLQKIGILKSHE
jgi:hypothetical protein